MNLTERREVAKNATHNEPWEADVDLGAVATANELSMICRDSHLNPNPGDIRHIAAFDPPTVLAMLDLIEEARRLMLDKMYAWDEADAVEVRAWLARTEEQ